MLRQRISRRPSLYSETIPAMVPVFLLGSAVYFVCLSQFQTPNNQTHRSLQGLQLTQSKLSHEKYMQEATQQVLALEAEIDVLQAMSPPIPDASMKKISRWWW